MQEVVQSVSRALDILELLAEYDQGIGITDISNELQLHKSTVHRLLGTLIQKGYVKQHKNTNLYSTTLKLFQLGSRRVENIDLLEVAKPYLNQLAELTKEVVHLVVREETEIVYIDKVEGNQTIRMHSSIGRRSPIYCTAVGKALLASLDDSKVAELLEKCTLKPYTEFTITDFKAMDKELKWIQKNGYAIDNEENELGVRCVAAPIFNHLGKGVAAISISGPSIRMTNEQISSYSKKLIEYSRKVSLELGYTDEGH